GFLRAKKGGRCSYRFETISQAAQVSIVSFWIVRRLISYGFLFPTGELRAQLARDCFRDVALDREDIGQLAIVDVGPDMRIVSCFDQLHVDAHGVGAL